MKPPVTFTKCVKYAEKHGLEVLKIFRSELTNPDERKAAKDAYDYWMDKLNPAAKINYHKPKTLKM